MQLCIHCFPCFPCTEIQRIISLSSYIDKGDTASGASPKPKVKRLPPLQIDGRDHLPFQLQIEYTGRDGSRCVRVISQAKPVTRDRDIAERGE